jgi:hypothetical protein
VSVATRGNPHAAELELLSLSFHDGWTDIRATGQRGMISTISKQILQYAELSRDPCFQMGKLVSQALGISIAGHDLPCMLLFNSMIFKARRH